jgi:phosphate:Na+ symporter
LAAETPRQVANTHTIFSVGSTLILIWFAGPLARLAQIIAPSRAKQTRRAGDPLYLDDASLTAPALALQRLRLEEARLGELVLAMVRAGPVAAIEGKPEDIESVIRQNAEVDRLASAILVYIGRLSQDEHSEDQGTAMVDLTQTTNNLVSIADIVSLGQRRIAEGVDLARLRDETTSRLGAAVARNLDLAVRSLGESAQNLGHPAAKDEIERLTVAARQSVLDKLQLADKTDALRFRLANDMIEQLRQIARFTRRIGERAGEGLGDTQLAADDPGKVEAP